MKHILIIIFLAFFSIPCNAQWMSANFPSDFPILAFGVHDTTLFWSYDPGASGDSLIFRYYPPTQWARFGKGLDRTQGNITSFATLGKYFFASIGNYRVTYQSTNNGTDWQESTGNDVVSNGTYLFGISDRAFTTDPPYIAISRDSGTIWDSITNFNGGSWVTNFATNGACIYASGSNGIYRSTDNGTNWSKASTPISEVTCFTVVGTAIYGTDGTPGVDSGQLMRSLDSGFSWKTVPTPGFTVQCLATDNKHLFAAGWEGVNLLDTDGVTWLNKSDSLKGNSVVALGVFDTLLFADFIVNSSYVLDFRSIPQMAQDTTASVVQAVSPSDALSIYPNPASDEVTIISGGTSIYGVSVMDVLGENVMEESNMHENEITLDVSKLPSGTYFFRIQTSQGTKLRKVVINRGA